MNCNDCKKTKDPEKIPYIVHESAMARAERQFKRLWIVILLLIVLLVGSNVAWLVYESQVEIVEEVITQTVEQESDGGNNNFVGGDNYGVPADSYED